VVVLALAALTNVALALQKDPAIASLWAKLVVLGGAYQVCGNVNPAAEANIFGDAEAADFVLRHAVGETTFLLGLDVTHQCSLTAEQLASLEGARYCRASRLEHCARHEAARCAPALLTKRHTQVAASSGPSSAASRSSTWRTIAARTAWMGCTCTTQLQCWPSHALTSSSGESARWSSAQRAHFVARRCSTVRGWLRRFCARTGWLTRGGGAVTDKKWVGENEWARRPKVNVALGVDAAAVTRICMDLMSR